MKKSEAITLHTRQWGRFPVFVWMEGAEYVAQVDGVTVRAKTHWQLDGLLDGIAPAPRSLYLVDEPDYEDAQ